MFSSVPERICRDISTEEAEVFTVMRSMAEEKARSPKLSCIDVAMPQRYCAPAAGQKTAEGGAVRGLRFYTIPICLRRIGGKPAAQWGIPYSGTPRRRATSNRVRGGRLRGCHRLQFAMSLYR